MPTTAGQEPLPLSPHYLGRWYKNAKGTVFRLREQPTRLFQAAGDPSRGIEPDPERYHGPVELVTSVETHLLWRLDDTELLPWWTALVPRWLMARLYPLPMLPPAAPRADRGLISEGVPSVSMGELLRVALEEDAKRAKEAELLSKAEVQP
jgi:hypothetical protein